MPKIFASLPVTRPASYAAFLDHVAATLSCSGIAVALLTTFIPLCCVSIATNVDYTLDLGSRFAIAQSHCGYTKSRYRHYVASLLLVAGIASSMDQTDLLFRR